MSYRSNPPCREDGKTVIPWGEWRDSILGEKVEIDDGFQTGDGIKNAERILKKMVKHDAQRAERGIRLATKVEIKKIKERDERRKKRRDKK